MQHIAYSLYQTFMVATLFDGGNSLNIYGSGATVNFEVFTFAIYVDFYIFTYLGLYLMFKKNLKKDEEFYVTNTWLFLLVVFMFISAIVLNSIMIYKYDAKTNQISLIVTFIYSIISCLLVLVVQFKLKEADFLVCLVCRLGIEPNALIYIFLVLYLLIITFVSTHIPELTPCENIFIDFIFS